MSDLLVYLLGYRGSQVAHKPLQAIGGVATHISNCSFTGISPLVAGKQDAEISQIPVATSLVWTARTSDCQYKRAIERAIVV